MHFHGLGEDVGGGLGGTKGPRRCPWTHSTVEMYLASVLQHARRQIAVPGSFSPWSAWPRLGRSGAGAAELRCQLQLDSWLTTCPARSSYAWYVAAIVYAMRSLKAAKAM